MKKNKIFNPKGEDKKKSIIKGNTTGIFSLADIKYSWTKQLYQVMVGNFWLPEKVGGLLTDRTDFQKILTPEEKKAYKGILSFLVFLDSIQTVNVPNISDYITAPEVNRLLAVQSFQELIHASSYEVILDTVTDSQERDEITYFWKNNDTLKERISYIGNIYQEFLDNQSDENFFKVLIANYLLEGIYFYNGFAFFDTMAYHEKMVASSRMINYIRKDEETHLVIFINIIKEIKKEFPEIYDEEAIKDMMKIAVEQEIAWTNHIIGNDIKGFSESGTDQYTKWLSNKRMKALGIDPLYPDAMKNPYKHLDAMADNNSEKANFFETTVTNYTQSTSMNGTWDF